MTNTIHLRQKDNRVKELTEKITDIIYEYAGETSMTYAFIVGVLNIIAHELEHEAGEDES